MAIDTNEKKLSVIDMGEPFASIPLGGDGIDQGDQQHLLDGYSGILWITAGYDLDIDGAMLIKGDEPYNWFVLNADDGAAGVYGADDAIANDRYDAYDKCGFDTIESALTHPWAVAYSDKPIWDKLGDLAEAILARSMGVDWSGTFRFRSRYEEEDGEDPSAIVDITDDDVPNIGSNIERATHNHIVIRGAKIKKMTEKKLMWSVFETSIVDYSHGQLTPLTISDGDYWPDPDEFTDEFIARFRTGPTEGTDNPLNYHRDWMQDIDDHTMIGAKSVVAHIVVADTDGIDALNADFTEIFFDVLPEGVRIKYRNDAGETMNLYMYALYGLPIYKIGGKNAVNSGFVHDYFKDASDIRKNGEKLLTITNDFLIDKTQIKKVAEYHWKERLSKHQYRQSLQGNRLYLLPGEWVNVDVGSAGYHEYLDYKGEFREIHWSWDAKGTERTDVIIDEQESNWKAQSNYTARFEEYGHPYKEPDAQGQTIVVASSESADIANFYCDGTSDEDEINAAINYLAALGGGTVQLTIGTFYIDGPIVMKAQVELRGHGWNTIIEKNCDNYGITLTGLLGSEHEGIILDNFKIIRNASDTNIKALIYSNYTNHSTIQNLYITDSYGYSINMGISYYNKILNNKIIICQKCGIYMSKDYNIITGNFINDATEHGMAIHGNHNVISNNIVKSNDGDGIQISKDNNEISGNTCIDNGNSGIDLVAASGCMVAGCRCSGNTGSGVRIQSDSDNNSVTGGVFNSNDYGVLISNANCDRNVITGNRCVGNTTDDINNQGTNTTISGNDYD